MEIKPRHNLQKVHMDEQKIIKKIMTVKKIMINFLIVLFVLALYVPQTSALDVKTQALSSELSDNEDISFEIDISDYNYASYVSIETGIIKKGNEQIFDFGELNEKYAEIDKYRQNVILDIPKDYNSFKVKISGKTPPGIEISKEGKIEIATFADENLKYYEVKLLDNNKKVVGQQKSKISRLIINEKIQFGNSLKNIQWKELENAKNLAQDMFDRGLVTDAKNLVSVLDKITPDSEDILPYKELWKNITLLVIIIIIAILAHRKGYVKGQEE